MNSLSVRSSPCVRAGPAGVRRHGGSTAQFSSWLPRAAMHAEGSQHSAGLSVTTVEPLVRVSPAVEVPEVVVRPAPAVAELQGPAEYQQLLANSGDQLVLVDYYATWCGPCQLMHRELDKLATAFPHLALAKLNVGHHEEFATSLRIRSLPTFRLFQGGRLLDQVTGAKPRELRQLLAHYYRPG